MLATIIDEFEVSAPGLANFEVLVGRCMEAAKENRDHAAAYCLLAMSAQRIIDRFHGAPLSVSEAKAERQKLVEAGRLLQSCVDGTADRQLQVLNSLAYDLVFG